MRKDETFNGVRRALRLLLLVLIGAGVPALTRAADAPARLSLQLDDARPIVLDLSSLQVHASESIPRTPLLLGISYALRDTG